MQREFTGQERDAETGLDYFGARYLSGVQGRFTSPDLPFADQRPTDPQSWNLYSYVRNRPLALTDSTGNCSKKAGPDGPASDDPGKPCLEPGSTSVTVTADIETPPTYDEKTVYVFDAMGQLMQEVQTGGTVEAAGRSYLFQDHLGSTRMRVDPSGTRLGWWDYAPFGEVVPGVLGARTSVAGGAYDGPQSSGVFAAHKHIETVEVAIGRGQGGLRIFGWEDAKPSGDGGSIPR